MRPEARALGQALLDHHRARVKSLQGATLTRTFLLSLALRSSAALAGVIGCSSTSTPVTVGPTPDAACADAAKARCSRINVCSAQVLAVRYPDEATCEARDKANCVTALSAASTGNSPDNVASCAKALNGAVNCAAFLDNTPAAGCETKAGALPDGAACAFSGQCKSAACLVGPSSVCGTCGPAPGVGASCATTFCGPGFTCSRAMVCGVPVGSGQPCDAAPCTAGFVCGGAVGGRSCQPIASVAAAGQPCGIINSGFVTCAAQGFCRGPTGQPTGTCLAAAADGAACDVTNGPLCALFSRCVDGKCQVPNPANCH